MSAAGETLASRWPPPRRRGRNPPPRAGGSLGIPGVQAPHGPEQVQPRGSVQTATYCPLARTWAARPGRSRMCPRLLSQPCRTAARVQGADFGAGARWGLTGQQGETGSRGTAIYKLAFYFGRLLSSSSPSAGRKKAPLSWCRMSWGRALTHTMGQLMCPASGGPAAGLQWGAAATSTHAATGRHGLPCQERGRQGSRTRSFVTPANATALARQLPRGTRMRNTPALHSMSPSFPGSPWCHRAVASHCQGREQKPAQSPSITSCACLQPQAGKSSSGLCLQGLGLSQDSSLTVTARKHNKRLAPGRWRGQPQLWGSPSRTCGLWRIPLEGFGEGSLLQ